MNRRELIRGAVVVAAASALPAAASPAWSEPIKLSYDEYVAQWHEVHDYLVAYLKQHYGVDELDVEAEQLAHGLVEYNFGAPWIE